MGMELGARVRDMGTRNGVRGYWIWGTRCGVTGTKYGIRVPGDGVRGSRNGVKSPIVGVRGLRE